MGKFTDKELDILAIRVELATRVFNSQSKGVEYLIRCYDEYRNLSPSAMKSKYYRQVIKMNAEPLENETSSLSTWQKIKNIFI